MKPARQIEVSGEESYASDPAEAGGISVTLVVLGAVQTAVAVIAHYTSPALDSDTAVVALIAIALVGLIMAVVHLQRLAPRLRVAALIPTALQLIVLLAGVYVLALVANPTESKLFRLGLNGADIRQLLFEGFFVLVACLSAAVASCSLIKPRAGANSGLNSSAKTYWVLFVVGTAGLAIRLATPRDEAFATRGEGSGDGVLTLLYWAAPLAVAFAVARLELRAVILVSAAALTTTLVYDGNRSPLLLVVIAIVFRLLRLRGDKLVILATVVLPIGLLVFAAQTTWRALLRDYSSADLTDIFAYFVSSPLRTVTRAGFDSVEGAGLSLGLARNGPRPEWWDPAVAVLNFVPRAIWADKPGLFGTQVGAEVLGVTAGGIFLSGPGYLIALTGSFIMAIVLTVTVTVTVAIWVSRCAADSVYAVIGAAFVVRFMLAGDAFDLFLAMQAVLIFFGVNSVVGAFDTQGKLMLR